MAYSLERHLQKLKINIRIIAKARPIAKISNGINASIMVAVAITPIIKPTTSAKLIPNIERTMLTQERAAQVQLLAVSVHLLFNILPHLYLFWPGLITLYAKYGQVFIFQKTSAPITRNACRGTRLFHKFVHSAVAHIYI